jgi:hypothetical protein
VEGRKPSSGFSEVIRHSMAWPRKAMSSWRPREGLPRGHPELPLDQVDPGDELGDGCSTWIRVFISRK